MIHKIHHIYYGYGYKIPFINVGYFPRIGFHSKGFRRIHKSYYHNCTKTKVN